MKWSSHCKSMFRVLAFIWMWLANLTLLQAEYTPLWKCHSQWQNQMPTRTQVLFMNWMAQTWKIAQDFDLACKLLIAQSNPAFMGWNHGWSPIPPSHKNQRIHRQCLGPGTTGHPQTSPVHVLKDQNCLGGFSIFPGDPFFLKWQITATKWTIGLANHEQK